MPDAAKPALDADVRDEIVRLLPRLRRFCMALTQSQADGEDLMQAAVERALTRIDQWTPGTRLDSWMYRIAQNHHIDRMRSLAARGVHVDDSLLSAVAGDDGRAVVEGRSDLARAQAALNGLPDAQRAVFALVVIDELSYRDAADVLDIPVGTVMSRLARARRAIDAALHGEPVAGGMPS